MNSRCKIISNSFHTVLFLLFFFLFSPLVRSDTTQTRILKISKEAITSKVVYSAKDSIRLDAATQKIFLFGNASVAYEDMTLTAEFIEFNMSDNTVFAVGGKDSVGKDTGNPVFKDADQEFMTKTIRYNFKTKKGLITEGVTKEGEGFLHSEKAKKDEKDILYIQNGSYTTCEHPHPHFAIKSRKIKVIPDDKILTGPAYLSIMDVPTPIALPFGIFPNKKGRASGILIPGYGESDNRGYFLSDGGYYFGFSDKVDLALRGDIYSRGSWAVRSRSGYNNRYRYNGAIALNYSVILLGERELPGFSKQEDFFIDWQHFQDQRARPNTRFSASVKAGSSNYNTYNSYIPTDYLSNTFLSSISFQKSFAGTPFNLSAGLTHSQNTQNRMVSISLPEMIFSMNSINIFKRKKPSGNQKWYENINVGYSSNLKNTLNTPDSLLFKEQSLNKMQNGISHSVPVSTSFKLLKHFSLTPSLSYSEWWYFQTVRKRYGFAQSDTIQSLITDTVYGFSAARNLGFSASLSTRIYGMYQFSGLPVKVIRHIITPTLRFTYNPDFSDPAFGFFQTIENDPNKVRYSIYERTILGGPLQGRASQVNFDISNNLEMKVKNLKDTVTGTKKIVLIDELLLSSVYNFAADSLNMSPILLSGRTRLFRRLDIRYNAKFDPYVLFADTARKSNYNINVYEWTRYGRPARITDADWQFSLTLNLEPKNFEKIKLYSPKATQAELDMINKKPEAYVDFKMPWKLNISYSLLHTSDYFYLTNQSAPDSVARKVIQTLSFSGEINITGKWKISVTSGYDFVNNEISYTSVDIYRDLHCWEIKFNWIPFGFRKSYIITIQVRSSVLQDLKLTKKRDLYDY